MFHPSVKLLTLHVAVCQRSNENALPRERAAILEIHNFLISDADMHFVSTFLSPQYKSFFLVITKVTNTTPESAHHQSHFVQMKPSRAYWEGGAGGSGIL